MAKSLHEKWKHLGRKMHGNVKTDPDRYSLIYLDNPFVVPGGRFRECYYWDSYWTILGLLGSIMTQTARGEKNDSTISVDHDLIVAPCFIYKYVIL